MAIENSTAELGSASWIGADADIIGIKYHERATTFFATVKWDVLVSTASGLRNGIPCEVSERYSIGHFNMVRRITFVDGVSWVARLRMPHMRRELLDVASVLKVEVASMKFLKAKTSIPVPEVHSYNTDPTNDIGAPYILMDYIHGTVAEELRCARGHEWDQFGTPDQDRKFRQQMAEIQVKLASITFDKIGCLYQDEQTSDFFIGPDYEMGKGPWTCSTDYYADLAEHRLRDCTDRAKLKVQMSSSFALPVLFKHLISLYGQSTSTSGPFRLLNRDLGAHNLLVDDDFNIIGLIDLDGVMTAPIEAVAQYPAFTGMHREAPGHVETKPAAIDRIKKTEPKLEEYKNMVEMAEGEMGGEGHPSIARLMFSDAASIVQGLQDYECHQDWVNDMWMKSYAMLLRKAVTSRGDNLVDEDNQGM